MPYKSLASCSQCTATVAHREIFLVDYRQDQTSQVHRRRSQLHLLHVDVCLWSSRTWLLESSYCTCANKYNVKKLNVFFIICKCSKLVKSRISLICRIQQKNSSSLTFFCEDVLSSFFFNAKSDWTAVWLSPNRLKDFVELKNLS